MLSRNYEYDPTDNDRYLTPTFYIWKTRFSDDIRRRPYPTASVCPQTESGRAVPARWTHGARTMDARRPQFGRKLDARRTHDARVSDAKRTQNGHVSDAVFDISLVTEISKLEQDAKLTFLHSHGPSRNFR